MRMHRNSHRKYRRVTLMRTEKSAKPQRMAVAMMLAAASMAALPRIAAAESLLRIGTTPAHIPRTLGHPNQGFEGHRFTRLTKYDALSIRDLSSAHKPGVV